MSGVYKKYLTMFSLALGYGQWELVMDLDKAMTISARANPCRVACARRGDRRRGTGNAGKPGWLSRVATVGCCFRRCHAGDRRARAGARDAPDLPRRAGGVVSGYAEPVLLRDLAAADIAFLPKPYATSELLDLAAELAGAEARRTGAKVRTFRDKPLGCCHIVLAKSGCIRTYIKRMVNTGP